MKYNGNNYDETQSQSRHHYRQILLEFDVGKLRLSNLQ